VAAVSAQPRQRDEDLLAVRQDTGTIRSGQPGVTHAPRHRHQTSEVMAGGGQERDRLDRIDRLADLRTRHGSDDLALVRTFGDSLEDRHRQVGHGLSPPRHR
jgi:hypothetical protein